MRDWDGKRYWLVGASEGLGRALADVMSRAGVELILSARSGKRLDSLVRELPGRSTALPMDVRDLAAVARAAGAVGRLDGIVYMAGVYWPFPAQEWDAEKSEAMLDVNLTGAARVLGHVVPKMAERGSGHVVMIGSLSGFRGVPGAIGYASGKAGLMHLAESMRVDLRGSGVEVQLANPGFVRTRLTDRNDFRMPFLMEPEDAAQQIFEHMNSNSFKRNFPTLLGLGFRLTQFLPDWAYHRLFRRYY